MEEDNLNPKRPTPNKSDKEKPRNMRKLVKEEEDPIASVERVLALSDADFEKWLDRVISAGLAPQR